VQELYFDEEREREREREFLESLRCLYLVSPSVVLCLTELCRSPDIDNHDDHRGSIGGWGLGNPHEEDTSKKLTMEDEDDELDWDQAQRIVGVKVNENGYGSERR